MLRCLHSMHSALMFGMQHMEMFIGSSLGVQLPLVFHHMFYSTNSLFF